jgi:FtsH-binding integral membrane protein
VYLAGFIIAAVVAISLALVAWGAADSGNDSVSTAILVAMTGITGAIIGGLFGAYKGQSAVGTIPSYRTIPRAKTPRTRLATKG